MCKTCDAPGHYFPLEEPVCTCAYCIEHAADCTCYDCGELDDEPSEEVAMFSIDADFEIPRGTKLTITLDNTYE